MLHGLLKDEEERQAENPLPHSGVSSNIFFRYSNVGDELFTRDGGNPSELVSCERRADSDSSKIFTK